MGDLIGTAVAGTLYYVGLPELERIRKADRARIGRTKLFADLCRLNALYMIARAGSGHIGSSFSSLDIVSWLHLEELGPSDVYFSSKGHDAPGLYAVLLALGRLPFDKIHTLRRLGGLPGHPDVATPGIATNTGSLGMGISKAKGMALARRRMDGHGRIFVLTGDGELQEGQIWESLISAVNLRLREITVIVDHNKLQSDTFVEKTSALGDLEAKFRAFGAHVQRVDGHDLRALADCLERARGVTAGPQVIVADTIKGAGVSFMEHTALDSDVALYRFHSGAPDARTYTRAAQELLDRIHHQSDALGIARVAIESVEQAPANFPAYEPERLIPAYARALADTMQRVPRAVCLDADLAVDTGQMDARRLFPERFFECGIAEMDMVSMAGGMALSGLVPICHSFACFLSTRANEQIYNNATERTKVVYVASLAGLLPGGPGHSHQSVRDIAALSAVPGLTLIAPSSAREVALALEWCVERARGSSVLRLESVPCDVPYRLPDDYWLTEGQGVELRSGNAALFVGYGPVLLSEAYRAAELLERDGLRVGVVNLPWLNHFDTDWVLRTLARVPHVFALDNHYTDGGQGQALAALVAGSTEAPRPHLHRFGVEDLPACGTNSEVLRAHRLDAESLAERARQTIGRQSLVSIQNEARPQKSAF